jgi:Calcineurin-like phosphoesterase
MSPHLTRRAFLQETLGASAASLALPLAGEAAQSATDAYAVLLLGDVHFDRLSHHDMRWLEREKPNDVRQVQNYSRLTEEVWPLTLRRIRAEVAASHKSSSPVALVAHIGDFVEGLCGTPALAEVQCAEAVASVREASFGAPFVFCKGNHDITGPGAPEAFDRVLRPFLLAQAESGGQRATGFDVERANVAIACRRDWFLFLDAYDDPRALDWMVRVLKRRDARHLFVLVHPPVVPYGARATWHMYATRADLHRREQLLTILGEHGAFVLTGHIHKYAALARATPRGRFVQLAISSVIPRLDAPASLLLSGVQAYTPDQTAVEPAFSPGTEADRRAVIAAEAPQIEAFEYGDVPGYAVISIDATVRVRLHAGLAIDPWRTLDLSALRERPGEKFGSVPL